MAAPEASGKAFLGLIKQIKTQHGGEAFERVSKRAGPKLEAVLEQRINAIAWYPYEAFVDLLVTADGTLGKGDFMFCRHLGANAGERDLSTVFKLLRRLASPERLIRSCDRVWESYYKNAGRMEAVTWKPEDTTLRIYDFPGMHRAHCRLMEGWMIETMNVIGVKVDDGAAEVHCQSRGAPHHEFHCTWKR